MKITLENLGEKFYPHLLVYLTLNHCILLEGKHNILYDKNGVKYLDGINNIQHVGHAHPRISNAAYKQLQILNTNTRYLDQHVLDYAEKLLKKLPEKIKCLFFYQFRKRIK